MQVQMGKNRRNHRPLWTAFLRLEPPTVFHHASLEPFPDQADDSLIPHPMFPKLDQPIVLELVEKGSDVEI